MVAVGKHVLGHLMGGDGTSNHLLQILEADIVVLAHPSLDALKLDLLFL